MDKSERREPSINILENIKNCNYESIRGKILMFKCGLKANK